MRIFTMMLAALMCLVLALACGGSGETKTDAKQEAAQQTATQENEEAATQESQEAATTESHVQTDINFFVTETGEQQALTFTTTTSGLKYADIKVGDGVEAVSAMTVNMHYIGWFFAGEAGIGQKFAASYDQHMPFTFTLGQGQVIKGWDEGIAGIKQGGKRRLVIPPDLGYGAAQQGPIPANSTLVFDVEFLGAK